MATNAVGCRLVTEATGLAESERTSSPSVKPLRGSDSEKAHYRFRLFRENLQVELPPLY